MPFIRLAVLTLILATLAGCGTGGSAQGGASENGGGGRIKIGFPF